MSCVKIISRPFSNLFINLSGQEVTSAAKAKEDGLAVITYGNFINALIAFIIVAWVLFMIVKAMNAAKKLRRKASQTLYKIIRTYPKFPKLCAEHLWVFIWPKGI